VLPSGNDLKQGVGDVDLKENGALNCSL